MDLRFESGKVAGARGWRAVEVVDTAQLADQTPSHTPLVVEAAAQSLTIDSARTIAALHAAGRSVILVTDSPPAADITQWIPEGCVHVVGTPLAAASEEAAPRAEAGSGGGSDFFGPYPPDIDQTTRLESIASDLEAEELTSLAGLLESTSIALDWDREWWMRGSICLHTNSFGWDARNDILQGVGFVALPLRIGDSLVLGVGDIQGQYCDEGCYVITGSWRRLDVGSYRGIYTDGGRDVGMTTVEILLKDWSDPQGPDTPDSLPLSVRSTPHGEETVLEVAQSMLLEITNGLLMNGAHGFKAAKPHLQTRLDEFRTAAAEYLRSYA